MPIVYGPIVQGGPTLTPVTPQPNSHAMASLDLSNPNVPHLRTRAYVDQQNAGSLNATAAIWYRRTFRLRWAGQGPPPLAARLMANLGGSTDFDGVADATAGGIPFIIPPVVPIPAPASFSAQTQARLVVRDDTGTVLIDINGTAGPYSGHATFLTDDPPRRILTLASAGVSQVRYNKRYELYVFAVTSATATIGGGANFALTNGRALVDADSRVTVWGMLQVFEPVPEPKEGRIKKSARIRAQGKSSRQG